MPMLTIGVETPDRCPLRVDLSDGERPPSCALTYVPHDGRTLPCAPVTYVSEDGRTLPSPDTFPAHCAAVGGRVVVLTDDELDILRSGGGS